MIGINYSMMLLTVTHLYFGLYQKLEASIAKIQAETECNIFTF